MPLSKNAPLKAVQVKAGGACLFLFLSLAYFGYAGFFSFRWYVETRSWDTVGANYQRSATVLTKHLNEHAVLHYVYHGRAYAYRAQLSGDQIHSGPIGEDTRLITLKVDPKASDHVLIDPRVDIDNSLKTGFIWMIILIIWHTCFHIFQDTLMKHLKE